MTGTVTSLGDKGKIRNLGNCGPSSADKARWGYARATMAEHLLGVHRPLAAQVSRGAGRRARNRARLLSPRAARRRPQHRDAAGIARPPGRAQLLRHLVLSLPSRGAGLATEARKVSGEAQFVGIDVDGNRASADPFVRRYAIGYPVAVDPSGSVAAAYGATGLPTTVFISASGREVGRHVGAISPGALTAEVDQLRGAR